MQKYISLILEPVLLTPKTLSGSYNTVSCIKEAQPPSSVCHWC